MIQVFGQTVFWVMGMAVAIVLIALACLFIRGETPRTPMDSPPDDFARWYGEEPYDGL